MDLPRRNPRVERPARRLRDRAVRQGDRGSRETRGIPHARRLARLRRRGGDTVAALNHAEVADDFTYVSTAGGAFLEWMEGKPLPVSIFSDSGTEPGYGALHARCVAFKSLMRRAHRLDS